MGVEPVLAAGDMCKRDVEYLGPMAYIANYQWIAAREPASEAITVTCDVDNVRVNNPVSNTFSAVAGAIVWCGCSLAVVLLKSRPIEDSRTLNPCIVTLEYQNRQMSMELTWTTLHVYFLLLFSVKSFVFQHKIN